MHEINFSHFFQSWQTEILFIFFRLSDKMKISSENKPPLQHTWYIVITYLTVFSYLVSNYFNDLTLHIEKCNKRNKKISTNSVYLNVWFISYNYCVSFYVPLKLLLIIQTPDLESLLREKHIGVHTTNDQTFLIDFKLKS